MTQENEGLGASASPTACSPAAEPPVSAGVSSASPLRPTGAGAWPTGPYVFDEISAHRPDDGLGYIYLAEHPSGLGPTLAHTGDMVLTSVENRALGHLFAAAPDLAEDGQFLADRLTELDGASGDPAEFMREFYGHVAPALTRFRAAISKALGKAA
jgi:hypothetical protein